MRIDQDDFLKSFLKKEANKPTETYTIDQKQFELIDETQNYISGPAVFETGALLPIERKAKKDQVPGDAELKTLDELFDEAHGESVLVADHPIGGLVENQKEQHQRMLNSIYRMPSGVGVNVWAASVITDLTKIASELDDAKLFSEAEQLDDIARSLLSKEAKKGKPSKSQPKPKARPSSGTADDTAEGEDGVAALVTEEAKGVAPSGIMRALMAVPGLVANPYFWGAVGVVAGGAVVWSVWDGIKENMRTDINDLYKELADLKADSEFTNVAGLGPMLDSTAKLKTSFESLDTMMKWGDDEFEKPGSVQAVNKVIGEFNNELSKVERNFETFNSIAGNSNIYRKFMGFTSLGGHIETVREHFSEWQKLLNSHGSAVAREVQEAQEATKKSIPPATRPPGGSISEVKKYLLDHDVSNIIGRKYEISEGPELDDGTRVVLELLAAEIRKDLGTRIPTTSDLINTTYNGMDQMMSIYLDPYKYMEE